MRGKVSIKIHNVLRFQCDRAQSTVPYNQVQNDRDQEAKDGLIHHNASHSKRTVPAGDPEGEPALDAEEPRKANAYRRAASFLTVGQIYLQDNPAARTADADACETARGWTPYFFDGNDPGTMNELMATVPGQAIKEIRQLQTTARATGDLPVTALWNASPGQFAAGV